MYLCIHGPINYETEKYTGTILKAWQTSLQFYINNCMEIEETSWLGNQSWLSPDLKERVNKFLFFIINRYLYKNE